MKINPEFDVTFTEQEVREMIANKLKEQGMELKYMNFEIGICNDGYNPGFEPDKEVKGIICTVVKSKEEPFLVSRIDGSIMKNISLTKGK